MEKYAVHYSSVHSVKKICCDKGLWECHCAARKKTNDKKVYEFKAKKKTNRLAKPSKWQRYSPFYCDEVQAFNNKKEKINGLFYSKLNFTELSRAKAIGERKRQRFQEEKRHSTIVHAIVCFGSKSAEWQSESKRNW